MRVLHLIDTFEGIPCPALLAQVADVIRANTEMEQAVWTIGSTEIAAAARSVDLRIQKHVACGNGAWHRWWTRRRMQKIEADRVHVWTAGASAFVQPGIKTSWSFHRLPHRWKPTASVHQALLAAPAVGLFHPDDSPILESLGVIPSHIQLLDPGVDARRGAPADRATIRAELGLEDPSLKLAAVIGDPSRDIQGMIGMMGVGLANESGRPVRVVMNPKATAVNRAQHVLASANRRSTLIVHAIAEEPWRLLGACDAAVVMAGAHSAAWAMAAGVPIVAADRPELRRILEEDRTARFGRADSCAQMAQQICRILDDPPAARAMAEQARMEYEKRLTAAELGKKLREWWMN